MSEEVSFQLMGGPTDVIKVYTTHTDTIYEIRIDLLFRGEDADWYGFQGQIIYSWEGHSSHSGAALKYNLVKTWGYINTRHLTGWLQFI